MAPSSTRMRSRQQSRCSRVRTVPHVHADVLGCRGRSPALALPGRPAGRTPLRHQHGERVAGLPRADVRAHARRGRRLSAAASARRPRTRATGRRTARGPTSSSCVRRSRTRTRPPGLRMRAASASARAGSAAWCSACESSATSTDRVGQRQVLEVAALPGDVGHLPPARASARARSSTSGSDRPRSPAAPSGPPPLSGSLRRTPGRRRPSAGSRCPRARDHAAQLRPGTSCRAVAVRARSSPCAGEALP